MGNQGYKPEAVVSTLLGLVIFGSLIAAYTRDGSQGAPAGSRQPAPPAPARQDFAGQPVVPAKAGTSTGRGSGSGASPE